MTREEREAKKVKKFLDTLVTSGRKMRELGMHPCKVSAGIVDSISYFSAGSKNTFAIQVFSGLEVAAEVLGLEIVEDYEMYADDGTVVLHMVYGDCDLFQLGYTESK